MARKFGVEITNPLPLAVQVRITCPTGALRTGDGKVTSREIKPGETLYIPTKGKCEVNIYLSVLRYGEDGRAVVVGDVGFELVKKPVSALEEAPRTEKKRVEPEEPALRSLAEMMEEMEKREEVKV